MERMGLMEGQVRRVQLVTKEILDQIKRLPWPLRLRALLPLSSLLSLRHLRRLLLQRLRRQLRLLLNRLATHLGRLDNQEVRVAKETLDPTAQRVIQALLVRVAALVQQDRLQV